MPFNYQAQPLPILTPGQQNPFNEAIKQGLSTFQEGMKAGYLPSQLKEKLLASQLENQINQIKAKYAAPMAEQNLSKIQQENQWYGPNMQSTIAGRNATTKLTNKQLSWYDRMRQSELDKAQREAQNPLLGRGGTAGDIGAILYLKQHPELQRLLQQEGAQPGMPQDQPNAPQEAPAGAEQPNVPQIPNIPGLPNFGQQIQPQQSPWLQQPQAPSAPSAPQQPMQQPGQQLNTTNLAQPLKTGIPAVDALLNKNMADKAYRQKMTDAFDWVHSPLNAKNYELAQLAGAGIDPSEAVSLLSSGKKVPEILTERGFDPKNPPPLNYMATPANITQFNNRKVALREIDVINDFVAKGLGPYAATINNISPAQIADALAGKNDEQQQDFLAARLLAPEASYIRLQLANGKAGITAAKQIMQKSLQDASTWQWTVSQKNFDAAQKKADAVLKKAMRAAGDALQIKSPEASEAAAKKVEGATKRKVWKKVYGKFQQVEE